MWKGLDAFCKHYKMKDEISVLDYHMCIVTSGALWEKYVAEEDVIAVICWNVKGYAQQK